MVVRNFSDSEEALLFDSLSEVVKIWAKGCGRANLSVNVVDGAAEVTLKFLLGKSAHSFQQASNVVSTDTADDTEYSHVVEKRCFQRNSKKKSPSRKKRNQQRAQVHQQRKKSSLSRLILPFSGKLLEVNPEPLKPSDDVIPDLVVTPPSSLVPPPQIQAKCSISRQEQVTDDIDHAKKKLFSGDASIMSTGQDSTSLKNQTKAYQRKEDEIWAKLFE